MVRSPAWPNSKDPEDSQRSTIPSARCRQRFPAAEQAALRAEGRAAITECAWFPRYANLLTFFREDYVPHARTTLAAEAMPDGKAWYREQIRKYTTLDLIAR